ncbi:MAG: hypothetical protein QME57_00475 [Patescibacteria group bacterium]|nr:hypothetical protein [Patescibacteria group bacterium]
MVSDDGSANHKVVEMLNGLDFQKKVKDFKLKRVPRLNDHQILHQVCLAHTKKNTLERLQKLKK